MSSISIEALVEKYKERIETVVQQSRVQLFKAIARRSPIDTGQFIANWNVSVNAPDPTITYDTNIFRVQRQIQIAEEAPAYQPVFMTNGLPYARHLEYGLYTWKPKKFTGRTLRGFSTQAPKGMVRISAAEFEATVKTVVGGTK